MMPKRINHRAPRKVSAQSRIADAVRDAIFAGELVPGDPIVELRLAELHDVSQSTVREALVRLEHAGLVRRIQNVGTLVTQMSPREIRERLRLRVTLEGLAAMEAARLALPEQLEEIGGWLETFAQAIAANNYFESARADLEFHRVIWRASGDGTLYQILDQITVPLFAFVAMERRRLQQRQSDDVVVIGHAPIAAALRARDADAAGKAIRTHFESSYAEFLGSGPDYRLAVA
jgi:DNA-binding GntR family transcriptional regulator